MKDYSPGAWGIAFIFSREGSVFPKAAVCALPNAIIAVTLWYLLREIVDDELIEIIQSGVTVSQSWTVYNWVIGFMVSFRASRAYSRWWEGGTLLQQARGEWFNAYSSLIAFCSKAPEKVDEVTKFQKIVARLTSMLYASALMSIATEPDLDFEIIDATGLSEEHLVYLRTQPDKCEIIMQWIQRLIVDNMGNGVLPIAPPVLSRVFQELSRGIVNIHNVRKITEFQFPFPAAQMIVTMLIVQWALTPVIAALLMQTPVWAFIVSFFPVFASWGINYIAGEIEQPFGTDYNDMPLHFMQSSLNSSILSLLDDQAQHPPDFDVELDNTQAATVLGAKAPTENKDYEFSKMRSVRCVTIADPDQHYRVKHRFMDHAADRQSMARQSKTPNQSRNWARQSREQSRLTKGLTGTMTSSLQSKNIFSVKKETSKTRDFSPTPSDGSREASSVVPQSVNMRGLTSENALLGPASGAKQSEVVLSTTTSVCGSQHSSAGLTSPGTRVLCNDGPPGTLF